MLNEIGRGANSVHDLPRIIGRVSVKPGNPLLSVAILDNVFVCFLCVNRLRPIYRLGKPGSCNGSEEMPRADDHQPCSPPQPGPPQIHTTFKRNFRYHVGGFGNCRGSYESRAWKGVRLELSADRAAMVPRSSQALAIPICHILGPHALHDSQRGHCWVHREPDGASLP